MFHSVGFGPKLLAFILAAGYLITNPCHARVRALQSSARNMKPSVRIPPVLQSRLSPLDASATARIVSQLKSGAGLGNVSAFCEDAGIFCNQTAVSLAAQLFALGPYTASVETTAEDLDLSIFFGEGNFAVGNKISKLTQPEPLPGRAFLPRALESELPFSSKALPQLLSYFHFTNTSNMARSMAKTLKVCEASPMENENKTCVASFGSMEQFAESVIGTRELEILVSDDTSNVKPGETLTVKGVKEIESARRGAVACHNAMFPYQVFYCHQLWGTRTFKVELQADNSQQLLMIVASCHEEAKLKDLSKRVFEALNVRLGELICHWNLGDNVIWVPAAP